tara:strand:+ start:614 stop:919 length:306 start_codon:yes stop_codon:yes gene_type:complete
MKVKDLNPGELYAIDLDPRVVVVMWKDNFLQIIKSRRAIRWTQEFKGEEGLKGKPALYCGPSQVPSNVFKQGSWRAYRFLINGNFYLVPGEHIQNISPFNY